MCTHLSRVLYPCAASVVINTVNLLTPAVQLSSVLVQMIILVSFCKALLTTI